MFFFYCYDIISMVNSMILTFCENPIVLEVMSVIKILIRIITIVVPIILIISSMIMFTREMAGGKDDLVSDGLKNFATKLIAAVLIFLIPTFVNIIVGMTSGDFEFSKCLNVNNTRSIQAARTKGVESYIEIANNSLSFGDYQKALTEVNKLSDEATRNKYLKKLKETKEQIDIKNQIINYVNEGTVESYNKAVSIINSIKNANARKELMDKINELKNILDKQVSGGGSSGNGGSSGGGNQNVDVGGSSTKLEMFFINSGNYDDAILIRTDSNVIMIDGGRYGCSKKVTPYLKNLGITKIDLMIGSHLHFNHIQAQADILNNFSVSNITYPDDIFTCASRNSCDTEDQKYILDAIKNKNMTPKVTKPGDIITIGDMKLYFMEPVSIDTSSKYRQNVNSSVFILKYKNNSFMFTGDIALGSSQINHIKSYASSMGISTNVDVLKYPHHGNTTISDNLLNTIKPKYVIVPNRGAGSKPTSDNISRLNNHGVKIYTQNDSSTGNIYLQSDGTNIKITSNY